MKTKNVKVTPNRGAQQKADEIRREFVRLKTELMGIFNCPDRPLSYSQRGRR